MMTRTLTQTALQQRLFKPTSGNSTSITCYRRWLTSGGPMRRTSLTNINRPPSAASRPPLQSAATEFPAEGVDATVSTETLTKNIVLGSALLSFCFGIAWYSMNAVGQAGTAGSDDPLAGLRQEAAAAADQQQRDDASTDQAIEMFKKTQAGEFDPDNYDDEDELAADSNNKRPWWKFW